jgi:histidine triad (HIT) family protein
MNCLFCKIINREIPAKIVYEDDAVLAFEDINPQAPVHLLVIPKKHIATTLDMTEDDHALVGRLLATANRLAMEKGVAEQGFRTVINCNRDAGQTVFHVHLHLLGGRPMSWPPG